MVWQDPALGALLLFQDENDFMCDLLLSQLPP